MTKDILTLIREGVPSFSKGQKLIANFILNAYDKAAFMTASKLGKTVNVSESTVVRFAAELGYDGYPTMQKALQEMIRNKLTSIQRIEVSEGRIGNHDVLAMVMHSDVEKIRMTLEDLDRPSFDASVDAIASAKRIYILGVRSSAALASFMSFYFNLIFGNVTQVTSTSASEMFEQILHAGAGDVVIGVSFPRYSKRTIKAMQYAQDCGATVIAVTDSKASPLSEHADHTLMAKSDMASFVDSLVAPLSLVNALIVAVGRKNTDQLSRTFESLEKIWAEYGVYESSTEAEKD